MDSDDRITIIDSALRDDLRIDEAVRKTITDGDPDTTYILRPITVDDHRAIVKKHTTQTINRQTHQKEGQIDWPAVNDEVVDFVLVEWSGVLRRGQPAACSKENKLRLDGPRRQALIDLAGMNQIARAPEVRAESFREPAGVPALLGR